jgi:hypothetical protein
MFDARPERRLTTMFGVRSRHGFGMVARTKHSFTKVSRPRRGSGLAARPKTLIIFSVLLIFFLKKNYLLTTKQNNIKNIKTINFK